MSNDIVLVPFDIDKAKNGERIFTRSGVEAQIISFDGGSVGCPIVAMIPHDSKYKTPYQYTEKGEEMVGRNEFDLFCVKELKNLFAQLFISEDGKSFFVSNHVLYNSKESASADWQRKEEFLKMNPTLKYCGVVTIKVYLNND